MNPVRSRRFAEAKGELAKTDRVDAAMLAALGEAFRELSATDPKGYFCEQLEAMLVSHEKLANHRTSLRPTAGDLPVSDLSTRLDAGARNDRQPPRPTAHPRRLKASMAERPGIGNRAMPGLSVMMHMAELWGHRRHNLNP